MTGAAASAFRIFGLTFRLAAPSDVWQLLLERLPPVDAVRPDAPADRVYHVVAGSDGLAVRRGRRRALQAPDAFAAAYHLAADVELTLARQVPERVFVHAGAVAWRGRGIVLPGPSGSGKSELVAALLRAGAELLSDEFAIFGPDGELHAYARPVVLRRPAQERLPANAFGARVAAGPVAPAIIAALPYRPGRGWATQPLSQGEAFLTLLRHTVAVRRRFEPTRAALLAVVGRSDAWRGTRGEVGEAAQRLLDLVPP